MHYFVYVMNQILLTTFWRFFEDFWSFSTTSEEKIKYRISWNREIWNKPQSWSKLLRYFTKFQPIWVLQPICSTPLPHFNVVALWKRCKNEAGWIGSPMKQHWPGEEGDKNISTLSLVKSVWYSFVSTSFDHNICS